LLIKKLNKNLFMKKLFTLCFATCLICLTVSAQNGKGKWLVGGNLESITRTSTLSNPASDYKSSHLIFGPKAGYFLSDRWAIGLAPSFSSTNNRGTSDKTKAKAYSIAPFVRYYQPVGEKLAIFGELSGISYQSGWNKKTAQDGNLIQNYDYRTYNAGVFIRPGIVWFVTPKIGLETSIGSLGYGYYNGKNTVEMPEETRKSTEEGFSGGLSLSYNFNLGILFYLGK
jgi:outer membrane protein